MFHPIEVAAGLGRHSTKEEKQVEVMENSPRQQAWRGRHEVFIGDIV